MEFKTTIQYLPDKDKYLIKDCNHQWELTRSQAAGALFSSGLSYNLDVVKERPDQEFYL